MAFLSHVPVILGYVEQLSLLVLPEPADPEAKEAAWQLDERTRAIGRQGVQEARRALIRRAGNAA